MTRNYEDKLSRSTQHLIARAFSGPTDSKKTKKCALAMDFEVKVGNKMKSSLFFLVSLKIIFLWKKTAKIGVSVQKYAHFIEHIRKVVCYSQLK
jgi:hypothetical protein